MIKAIISMILTLGLMSHDTGSAVTQEPITESQWRHNLITEALNDFYKVFPEIPVGINASNFKWFGNKKYGKLSDPDKPGDATATRWWHGICASGIAMNASPEIHLNKDIFKATKARCRLKGIIIHELGHCTLGLHHPNNPYAYTLMSRVTDVVMHDCSNYGVLLAQLKMRWLNKQYIIRLMIERQRQKGKQQKENKEKAKRI